MYENSTLLVCTSSKYHWIIYRTSGKCRWSIYHTSRKHRGTLRVVHKSGTEFTHSELANGPLCKESTSHQSIPSQIGQNWPWWLTYWIYFLEYNKANLRDLIAVTGLVILLKLDSNHRFFSLCDLEIWWMTLKNNRASLPYHIKLCASFQIHW